MDLSIKLSPEVAALVVFVNKCVVVLANTPFISFDDAEAGCERGDLRDESLLSLRLLPAVLWLISRVRMLGDG